MARIIAVCNAKGGVGKTSTCVNLGAYLAALGRRVLLVDFDPQGNASSALGVSPASVERSIYHGIFGTAEINQLIRPSVLYNFHLIPAAPHLAGALVELVNAQNREHYLRRFIASVRHFYDYILIDLPPSLSLLTVNGLIAADEVLIPVQTEYYSLEGLGQLLETVDLVRTNLGHNLGIAGALLTMTDSREKLSRDVARNVRAHFPHFVYKTEIPRHSAIAEAPSFSRPLLLYQPSSPGAVAYHRLAQEVLRQERDILETAAAGTHKNFGNFNIE